MSITLAAATAAQPDAGWGRLVALLVAGLVFWAGAAAHQRFKQTRDNPSPTALGSGVSGVKPQVSAGPDTTSDTTGRGVRKGSDLAVFVAQRAGKSPTMDIVREAKRRFGASKSATIRALKQARGQS